MPKTQTPTLPPLYVNASHLAALSGYHKYDPQPRAMMDWMDRRCRGVAMKIRSKYDPHMLTDTMGMENQFRIHHGQICARINTCARDEGVVDGPQLESSIRSIAGDVTRAHTTTRDGITKDLKRASDETAMLRGESKRLKTRVADAEAVRASAKRELAQVRADHTTTMQESDARLRLLRDAEATHVSAAEALVADGGGGGVASEERALSAVRAETREVKRDMTRLRRVHEQVVSSLESRIHQADDGCRSVERSIADTERAREASEAKTAAITAQLHKNVASEQACLETVRRDIVTQKGIRLETSIVDQYEKEKGTIVTRRNDRLLTKTVGNGWVLCGKIDGWDTHRACLIDAKKRKNRNFTFAPLYEKIQMHAYMVLTNSKRALIVQRHNNIQSTLVVDFDERLWNNVVDAMDKAHTILRHMRSTAELHPTMGADILFQRC
jgi:hypothetical protein